MIGTEQTLFGSVNIVDETVALLRQHEPPDGYYLAFSGGKDSLVLKHLCDVAGVKYDAHYNMTTVDPPELVKYIRREHPDVIFDRPEKSMFKIIEDKTTLPTRIQRYCCEKLKEHGGDGRVKLLGIRAEESASRGKRQRVYGNLISPILYWTELDVWEYIDLNRLPYCELYDTGKTRLGCILCPFKSIRERELDIERYPKFKQAYLNSFKKAIKSRKERGLKTTWDTPEDMMNWWIYNSHNEPGLFDE